MGEGAEGGFSFGEEEHCRVVVVLVVHSPQSRIGIQHGLLYLHPLIFHEGRGDLYSWGELAPKSSYIPETQVYKDTPETLPLTADAANNELGGKWRMPTKADFEALLALRNNEDYTFEISGYLKDGNGNDVKGMKITRKSTGKVLFFPAAGCSDGDSPTNVGSLGRYWTSNYYDTFIYPEAAVLAFASIDADTGSIRAYMGLSIRPVYDE